MLDEVSMFIQFVGKGTKSSVFDYTIFYDSFITAEFLLKFHHSYTRVFYNLLYF